MIKNIVYATSEGYAPLMAASIESLLQHNAKYDLSFFVLDNQIAEETKEKVINIAKKYSKDLIFISMTDYAALSSQKLEVNKLSLSTYSRLFIANLLPYEIDSVLYIDCDTIVNADLGDLLSTNLSGYGIAGVEDTMPIIEKKAICFNEDIRYFNAGVVLLNLKYWRDQHLFEEFKKFVVKYEAKVPYLDQGILNGVISDRLVLPLKYNVQAPIFAFHTYKRLLSYFRLDSFYSEVEYNNAKKKPAIVHLTSFFIGRPWEAFCIHPLRKLFYKYLADAGFDVVKINKPIPAGTVLKNLLFYYFQPFYLLFKKL